MAVYQIDLTKYTCTIGVDIAEGFADNFIEAKYNSDQWVSKTSHDGKVHSRAKVLDRSGTLKMRFNYLSPTVKRLRRLAALDYKTGEGIVPIMFTNVADGIVEIKGVDCYITKIPDKTYGNDNDVEIVFQVPELYI